jgi:ATP synthase protein I
MTPDPIADADGLRPSQNPSPSQVLYPGRSGGSSGSSGSGGSGGAGGAGGAGSSGGAATAGRPSRPGISGSTSRALLTGLAATAVAGAPVLVAGWLVAGGAGLAGAGFGVGLVAAFFSVSKLVLALVARHAPSLLLPAALGTYLVKIVALGIVLVGIDGSGAIDLTWLAWAVLTGVVAWVAAELWVATHTHVPFYDPAAYRAAHPGTADRPPPAAREPRR